MNLLYMYKNSFKLYKLTDFIQPFMLLLYAMTYGEIRHILDADFNQLGLLTYLYTAFFIVIIPIIKLLLYPLVAFYVTSTNLYQRIFPRTFFGTIAYMTKRMFTVGNHIEDDITIHGKHGTYTAYSGYKSKSERRSDLRFMLGLYYTFKFAVIDGVLRMGIHAMLYFFAPILYLIVVPLIFKLAEKANA